MSHQAVSLLLLIALGSAAAVTFEEDQTDAIWFIEVPPDHPDASSNCLQLVCHFEKDKTDFLTFSRMSIIDSDKNKDEPRTRLGYVTNVQATNEFGKSKIKVEGEYKNEGESHLYVTFLAQDAGYCQTYWCAAMGYDASHVFKSYYKKITVGPAKDSSCPPSFYFKPLRIKTDQCPAVSEELTNNTLALQNLAERIDDLSTLSKDSQEREEQLQALTEKVDELVSKQDAQETPQHNSAFEEQLAELTEKLDEQIQKSQTNKLYIEFLKQNEEKLKTALDITLSINTVKYDVSGFYDGHIYIASKEEPNFDLAKMNELCQASHGYLAEIGDEDELKFVGEFVDSIGNHYFAIGGNDVDSEGQFVYYNSKTPVPENLWAKGEPNNLGGEDCVMVTSQGLNDIRCNRSWRYVCEIPIA